MNKKNVDSMQRWMSSTLVIPVHRGREEALKALLVSVATAERCSVYPVEVLIITKDITEIGDLVSSTVPNFPVPIRTAVIPNVQSLAGLRNEGLRAVKTTWVHSIDSDTLVPPDYFVKLEQEMVRHESNVPCFQLNFAPSPNGSRWARYEAEVDQWVISRYISAEGVFGLNGMNFVARPDTLLSVGGFTEDLLAAEDVELGYRLHQAGIPVAFLPNVGVFHQYPDRLGHILRRKFWHGQGYALAFGRCPNLFRMRPLTKRQVLNLARKFFRPGFLSYYIISHLAFLAGMCHYKLLRLVARSPTL